MFAHLDLEPCTLGESNCNLCLPYVPGRLRWYEGGFVHPPSPQTLMPPTPSTPSLREKIIQCVFDLAKVIASRIIARLSCLVFLEIMFDEG